MQKGRKTPSGASASANGVAGRGKRKRVQAQDYAWRDDHIPPHIGDAFLEDLKALVSHLCSSQPLDTISKEGYLRDQLLSKFLDESVTDAATRRDRAVQKWLDVEVRNKQTNIRLMHWLDQDLSEEEQSYLSNLHPKVKSIIEQVLGTFSYRSVLRGGGVTTGASTRVKRGLTAAFQKLCGTPHASSTAIPYWVVFYGDSVAMPGYLPFTGLPACSEIWQQGNFDRVEYSIMFTVPKKSDIDRVACKEPEINMFLQKAVGDHIRARLRKVGIDLNDQTVNQAMARSAVELGLATVDLSAASDSVTKQLVMELLPWDYVSLMMDLRVGTVRLPDGTFHEMEMFSTMGNGFTFELESLIFYAITRAVMWSKGEKTAGRVSVFGDDIIAPTSIIPELFLALKWYGFTPNQDKSHWEGNFRESCGKHYLGRYDISPFFIREPIRKLSTLIRALNQLYSWGTRDWGVFDDPNVALFHRKWIEHVPHFLWGGQDPESSDALVTGHKPRKVMSRKKNTIKIPQSGGYIYWLTTSRNRVQHQLPPFIRTPMESLPNDWLTLLGDGTSIAIDTATQRELSVWKPRASTQQSVTFQDPYWVLIDDQR